MRIHPEIIVTPDQPTIKFREDHEQVDLKVELPKILHSQGWSCGTYFNVQFVDHKRTELLRSGLFVVSEETESLHTNEANPYQPMTRTEFNRKAVQIGDWWTSEPQEFLVAGVRPEVVWNADKEEYHVRRAIR